MTQIVVIRQTKSRKITELKITGHADFDDLGKDIVCAAISVLAQSVYYCLNYHLAVPLAYSAQKGNFRLALKTEPTSETEAAFMVAVLGFMSLEENYPKYLQVQDN